MNEDRGFAFPQHFVESAYAGMTKREWFAGQALAGLCANADYMNMAAIVWSEDPKGTNPAELVVLSAVKIADATLAELEKKQ